jgi:ABC-type lipoprotein release transport system permease subunit
MNLTDNVKIGIRALSVNKARSFLTVLGVVVGVAAVVCMVSLAAGAQAEVSEKIRTLGANLLLVVPGALTSGGGARLEAGTRHTLTEEDAMAIGTRFRVCKSSPHCSHVPPKSLRETKIGRRSLPGPAPTISSHANGRS